MGHVTSSRWIRPCHGGHGQSRRARLVMAVHVRHVFVASSLGPSRPGLGCSQV